MRFNIAKGNGGLTYEIRNIVRVAEELKRNGVDVSWENIGDPVNKGEQIPEWMKNELIEIMKKNDSYSYSPTKGVLSTREYLAEKVNRRNGVQITAEDILFFNGLGDAIAKVYGALTPDVRILLPEPAYSTHFLAEVAHASYPAITYKMNPYNNWSPDIEDIEKKVKTHKAIVGILVINPDNPTGFVYTEDMLKEIVRIARENDLFLIFDEIYTNMVYNGKKVIPLSDVIEDVPAISMKGISKEFPWPGGRCGWIEFYNTDKDLHFKSYAHMILNQKMSEVCSTTLPQLSIPPIMEHPEYQNYLTERIHHYEKLSDIAYNTLRGNPYVEVNRTNGAFYMTIVFNEMVLNDRQYLDINQESIKEFVESITGRGTELDKRFVYYLLASTGICVVPLTSFFTNIPGFRMTLLEKNLDKFEDTVRKINKAIADYVESVK